MSVAKKGLRLAKAWSIVLRASGELFALATTITLDECGGVHELWISAQGCLRYAGKFARLKFRALNELPLSFARHRDLGMPTKIQRMYNEKRPCEHEPLTNYVLHPEEALGQDFKVYAESGVCSTRLSQELQAIEHIPISEEDIEGAHRDNACLVNKMREAADCRARVRLFARERAI